MNLLEARHRAGLTRQSAAYHLGVAIATLARWEKGIAGVPSSALPRIQDVLGLTDSEVLEIVRSLQKEAS